MRITLRLRLLFWKIIEPLFPTVRDIWMRLGFISHDYRQPYLYGRLKAEVTSYDLRQLLKQAGFENAYLAWIDPDEVVNMRKLAGVEYQYHVRLFKDGEVRGHYEFAAETHPIKHLREIGMVTGEDYLTSLLTPAALLLPKPELALEQR